MDALVIARNQEVMVLGFEHECPCDRTLLGMDVLRVWAWMLW